MDERFLRRAVELAAESIGSGGGPFGAVIVRNGEVVAEAANSVTRDNDPTAHAEVNCIRRACERLGSFSLEGCEIYSSCEPCPMCLSAIYWARVSRIFFAATREDAAEGGFDDDLIYGEIGRNPSERRIPSETALRDEGRRVFAKWKAFGGRTDY